MQKCSEALRYCSSTQGYIAVCIHSLDLLAPFINPAAATEYCLKFQPLAECARALDTCRVHMTCFARFRAVTGNPSMPNTHALTLALHSAHMHSLPPSYNTPSPSRHVHAVISMTTITSFARGGVPQLCNESWRGHGADGSFCGGLQARLLRQLVLLPMKTAALFLLCLQQ